MPLPVFIGVIFGCMPFDMPIRRRVSPLALGSSLLLVVVLWKVILPSDKPVTLHAGDEEEWVDSLELLDTVSIKNTVKEPSNLGRILHPSENPMVTGQPLQIVCVLIKQSDALCWANGTMSSVVSLLWFGRFREVYCF